MSSARMLYIKCKFTANAKAPFLLNLVTVPVMQDGDLGCSRFNAQCVSKSQDATKSKGTSVKYPAKVRWMIILSEAQAALQHFTTFCWTVDHSWKNHRAIHFPLFSPFSFFHMVVSLHCSAFMNSINRLFSFFSPQHQINLPFSLTHNICFVLEVFEKKQMGNRPSPRCEVSGNLLILNRIHSCWYPFS